MPRVVTPESLAPAMKILLYGPQGAGKTVFCSTLNDHPLLGPALFANIEGGLISVAGRGDVEAEDISSTKDLEQLLWKIANRDSEFAKYRSLVIDSASELQTLNLQEVTMKAIQRDLQKYGAKAKRTLEDIDEIWQDDYGTSTAMLRRIFRMAKSLPITVIFTALPKNVYPKGAENNPNVQPIEVRPSLTDKLADSLMGYVDHVWYLFTGEPIDEQTGQPTRYILTRDRPPFRAKTRGMKFAAALGEVYANPTMPKLLDLFMQTEGGKTA